MTMKFRMMMALIFVLFSSVVNAESYVSISKSMVNGKWYEHRISVENLTKVPQWNPFDEPAPLPPHKAIAISRDYLKKQNEDIGHLALGTITIDRVISKKVKNRWKYMISILDRNNMANSFYIIVMMDGTVIDPVEISDPGVVCPEEE